MKSIKELFSLFVSIRQEDSQTANRWYSSVTPLFVVFSVFGIMAVVCPAYADPVSDEAVVEEKEEEEKEPVAKAGETIASTGSTGSYAAVGVGTIGAAPGDEQSVISASINRGRGNSCVAKIINNGKKAYSVSFVVIGESRTGSTAFRRSFSATVKPDGGHVERTVSGCSEDMNVRVVLNSAKAQ